MLYVWNEDRGKGHLCVSAHCFSPKKGTPDTSGVCVKAFKMWDLYGFHVQLLGSSPGHLWLLLLPSEPAGCCNWSKVTQINIGGQ